MADTDIEERTRAHLKRIAERRPAPGFESQVIAVATGQEKPKRDTQLSWSRAALMVAVSALMIVMVLVLSGHQGSDIFSNISNGLNTN